MNISRAIDLKVLDFFQLASALLKNVALLQADRLPYFSQKHLLFYELLAVSYFLLLSTH